MAAITFNYLSGNVSIGENHLQKGGCLSRLLKWRLLSTVFTKIKDKTPMTEWTHCVYQILCTGILENGDTCPQSYVGQILNQLRKRVNQHKNDIDNINAICADGDTALVKHYKELEHRSDLVNAKIIGTEHQLYRRLTMESLHKHIQSETGLLDKFSNFIFYMSFACQFYFSLNIRIRYLWHLNSRCTLFHLFR